MRVRARARVRVRARARVMVRARARARARARVRAVVGAVQPGALLPLRADECVHLLDRRLGSAGRLGVGVGVMGLGLRFGRGCR